MGTHVQDAYQSGAQNCLDILATVRDSGYRRENFGEEKDTNSPEPANWMEAKILPGLPGEPP